MKTETTPTPRTDKACWFQDHDIYRGEIINSNFSRQLERELTTETARADGLQHKLSEVYHWICAHDQDGFIDSLGYRKNLDRVGDRLKDEREQAEDDLKAVRKKLAAEERKNAGLQADVAMLNQRLIERTQDMLEKFAVIEAGLRKRCAEAERDAQGLATILSRVLDSSRPNPVDHPSMHREWSTARCALTAYEMKKAKPVTEPDE